VIILDTINMEEALGLNNPSTKGDGFLVTGFEERIL
jgi:hypothetical protein